MQAGRHSSRCRSIALLAALALGAAALPTGAPAAAADEDRRSSPSQDVCVDVRIGQETYYACLNQQLRRLAEQSHGPIPQPSVTATSPAPAAGTYNQAATRERMGNAFGVSAIPQRPPPPVFPSPLLNR